MLPVLHIQRNTPKNIGSCYFISCMLLYLGARTGSKAVVFSYRTMCIFTAFLFILCSLTAVAFCIYSKLCFEKQIY